MKILKGNIANIKGFSAVGRAIGIKKEKLDFGVIYSDKICNTAAVYTKNSVKGAPLIVTKQHLDSRKKEWNLENGKAQAIVINSGIANVCTGEKGILDAKQMCELVAKEIGIKTEDVLVASTGLIGAYLPMEKIKKGVIGIKTELNNVIHNPETCNIAEAILTTDLIKKEVCVKDDNFTIAGIAKGSGMIHPNMATMLAFICTDAELSSEKLDAMLKKAVNDSFNMITIDMDTSTSDMCIVMANGYAGKVNEEKFQKALTFICTKLAKKVAKDGEGATKLIEVHVKNAKDEASAKILAKSVVCSNLVKCAAYGNDPNWGRILCALGNTGIEFEAEKINVYFGSKSKDDTDAVDESNAIIVKNGVTANFDYEKIKEIMCKEELKIIIDMQFGNFSATAYGCDMTEKYIEINAHYHT